MRKVIIFAVMALGISGCGKDETVTVAGQDEVTHSINYQTSATPAPGSEIGAAFGSAWKSTYLAFDLAGAVENVDRIVTVMRSRVTCAEHVTLAKSGDGYLLSLVSGSATDWPRANVSCAGKSAGLCQRETETANVTAQQNAAATCSQALKYLLTLEDKRLKACPYGWTGDCVFLDAVTAL
jgi:hypothetical protein